MKKRRICGVCVIKCVEMCETNHARISCHAQQTLAFSIDLGQKWFITILREPRATAHFVTSERMADVGSRFAHPVAFNAPSGWVHSVHRSEPRITDACTRFTHKNQNRFAHKLKNSKEELLYEVP